VTKPSTRQTRSADQDAFAAIQALIVERAGIVLGDEKRYLVDAKLKPIIASAAVHSLEELVALVQTAGDDRLLVRIVEALTIGETSWFRDTQVFDEIRDTVIPSLIDRKSGSKRLSVWSAACASGQEPYSIAMLLTERLPQISDWSVRITATDINSEVLERARLGRYSALEIGRGLPAASLHSYFERDGGGYRIRDELKRRVSFDRLNLVEEWPFLPAFDLILLRNVLIYFDVDTRSRLCRQASKQLAPGGYLVVGGVDACPGLSEEFEPVGDNRVLYQRRSRD
jgi:chemotaxis protein methyltransferase CheR